MLSNSLLSVASGISFARFFRENLDEVESFLVVHLRRLDDEFHRVFLALDLPDANVSPPSKVSPSLLSDSDVSNLC